MQRQGTVWEVKVRKKTSKFVSCANKSVISADRQLVTFYLVESDVIFAKTESHLSHEIQEL